MLIGTRVPDAFWNDLMSVICMELMSVGDLVMDDEKMRAVHSEKRVSECPVSWQRAHSRSMQRWSNGSDKLGASERRDLNNT